MEVTRKSALTGTTRTLDLDVTMEQMFAFVNGALLQEAFPNLTAEEREFIKTGITAEEWDAVFA